MVKLAVRKLGTLGVDLSQVKRSEMPESWKKAITKLNKMGQEKSEEFRRKEGQALREANKAWEEGNWVDPK